MASRKKKVQAPKIDIATLQPDELNSLKVLVKEFMTRLDNVDAEIESAKEARKDLLAEYEEKIDIKTLNSVLKVLRIEAGVAYKHTYDSFYEVLKDDFVNGLTDEPSDG